MTHWISHSDAVQSTLVKLNSAFNKHTHTNTSKHLPTSTHHTHIRTEEVIHTHTLTYTCTHARTHTHTHTHTHARTHTHTHTHTHLHFSRIYLLISVCCTWPTVPISSMSATSVKTKLSHKENNYYILENKYFFDVLQNTVEPVS